MRRRHKRDVQCRQSWWRERACHLWHVPGVAAVPTIAAAVSSASFASSFASATLATLATLSPIPAPVCITYCVASTTANFSSFTAACPPCPSRLPYTAGYAADIFSLTFAAAGAATAAAAAAAAGDEDEDEDDWRPPMGPVARPTRVACSSWLGLGSG